MTICYQLLSHNFPWRWLSQKLLITQQEKNVVDTLPSAPCAFPQAAMTNASLTEMQATSCIPLFFKSSACSTKPGRCVWKQQDKYNVNYCKDDQCKRQQTGENSTLEQPGVNAPGTAKRTPFFPLKSWFIATLFPGSPSWTSTAGRWSPTCWRFRRQCRLQEK